MDNFQLDRTINLNLKIDFKKVMELLKGTDLLLLGLTLALSIFGTIMVSSATFDAETGALFSRDSKVMILAAILGAVFVGVGVGLCVKMGGAPCGDDALAMSISKLTKMKIQWAYLISDITVLALSLTYIPLNKIIWSLVTVVISGQIIGLIAKKK